MCPGSNVSKINSISGARNTVAWIQLAGKFNSELIDHPHFYLKQEKIQDSPDQGVKALYCYFKIHLLILSIT